MRLIDGNKIVMSLADWWYSSFGQEETEESKAIKKVMHQVEKMVVEMPEIVRCKDCSHRIVTDWYKHDEGMTRSVYDCDKNIINDNKNSDHCSYGEKQITGKLNNPDDSLLAEESKDCKEQKSKLESDLISRQAIEYHTQLEARGNGHYEEVEVAYKSDIESLPPVEPKRPKGEWVSCSEPPKDRRNVFIAHGTNDFKSCCIGHYEQGMGWYEDRNFFAKPIYDCKYWCDIPELPDLGNNQFGTEVSADMRGDSE